MGLKQNGIPDIIKSRGMNQIETDLQAKYLKKKKCKFIVPKNSDIEVPKNYKKVVV